LKEDVILAGLNGEKLSRDKEENMWENDV